MKFVAARDKLKISQDVSVQGSAGIGPIPIGLGIELRPEVSLPGVPEEEARTLVERAHSVCPYANTTRDNIDVSLPLV
jgi:osmotically inducible protein OsmC